MMPTSGFDVVQVEDGASLLRRALPTDHVKVP
jgi:hypothetical protein